MTERPILFSAPMVRAILDGRLQDISEEDARAEGCVTELGCCEQFIDLGPRGQECCGDPNVFTAVDHFCNLWNSIHGPDAWGKNPWVAAISFERIAK